MNYWLRCIVFFCLEDRMRGSYIWGKTKFYAHFILWLVGRQFKKFQAFLFVGVSQLFCHLPFYKFSVDGLNKLPTFLFVLACLLQCFYYFLINSAILKKMCKNASLNNYSQNYLKQIIVVGVIFGEFYFKITVLIELPALWAQASTKAKSLILSKKKS